MVVCSMVGFLWSYGRWMFIRSLYGRLLVGWAICIFMVVPQ